MRYIIFIIIILPLRLLSQNTIGFPDVINYKKALYNAGTQNWDIKQDNNGFIYSANNEGMLCFDGNYWRLFPLPNRTIVRSIDIDNNNYIYVGGQDELGYFSPDQNGTLAFTSLVPFIPEKERSFGDVWDIVSFRSSIFFRTNSRIFKFTGRTIEIFKSPTEWSFLGSANDRLFAQDIQRGLMEYRGSKWVNIADSGKIPPSDPVTSVFCHKGDPLYFTTLKNGIFKFKNSGISAIDDPALATIQSERIYSATALPQNRIALATTLGGLYIIDTAGRFIQQFTKSEGLQNNNILCVFADKQDNLWLGLDNGIDCIAYNSAVRQIRANNQDASGYAALVFDKKLFLGTSAGLFYAPLQDADDITFSRGSFMPISNSTGQVWNLTEINGDLLMGHHDGAFRIKDNQAIQISPEKGFWNFHPMSNVSPASEIVAGHYKGISFFDYSNESFLPSNTIPSFNESSRFVETDNSGNLWVSHPYHGIYKIVRIDSTGYAVTLYSEKRGLPSLLNNHVFKIKNEIVAATQKGVFTYDEASDKFHPSEYYKSLLGNQSIRYLREDPDGNIWFIHEKSISVLDLGDGAPITTYLRELNNKMLSGFESIYPLNARNIIIGGETGFFHINYEKYKSLNRDIPVSLREVRISNRKDSVIYGGYFNNLNETGHQRRESEPNIDYSWKSIIFRYSSANFGQQSRMEYSYRLKGFDASWSGWSEKSEKEYTNLPPGDYSFEIKARDSHEKESRVISYRFIILPPWYLTKAAYALYAIILSACILLLYRMNKNKMARQRKKHEEEQKRLQVLHQLEIQKAESELITLRNEKLQTEIDYKNSELATTAMHLVQKGELISKLKVELSQIMKSMDNEKSVSEIRKMVKILTDDDKMDKDWESFTQHFDKVHSDFIIVLKEKHGNLTPNETKICTYLRMNLSTKEIAQIMNISVRGVEISRYRLRKKLGLSTEVNLFDYLIGMMQK